MHSACGFHASQIDHPDDHPMVPDAFTCPFCAAIARQARVWAEEDKHLPTRPSGPRAGDKHPADGVSRFLRPATAEEIARHQAHSREGGAHG